MPSDKNNGFNDMETDEQEDSIPVQYMNQRNKQDQENLDQDTNRRNQDLNDMMNKPVIDSPKFSAIKKYLPETAPKEDVVPYDPNSGTLMNIGRFALNNLATDQFGGGMPVGGTMKAVEEGGAISIPMIERLMGKSGAALRDVPAAQQAMHEAGDLAAKTGAAGTDLLQAKAVQDNGRAMYMQARDAAALAARRKAAVSQALKNKRGY